MPNRYYAVNWIDGMKITRQHFVDQEYFLVSRIADTAAAQVLPFAWGLLPPSGPGQFSNDLQIEYKSNSEVEIYLRRFDALTPGGYRITIGDDDVTADMRFTSSVEGQERSAFSDNGSEDAYYVVLSVNPYERIPVGMLNPEEIPPRHPNVLPAINASLIPEQQFNPEYAGPFFVVVGRIVRKAGVFARDELFIPPCTSIRSHPQLVRYYENLGIYINEMQQQALSIVQKIKNKSQQSDLARNIQYFCEETLSYIAQIYFHFRNVAHNLPPIHTVQDISSLSSHLYNYVQMLSEKDKEEMLKYIFEWCDVAPSQLETMLTQTIELRYEHTRIGQHMQQLDELLKLLAHIFQRLNRLDYIGIRKENIVVKEEIIMQTTKTKKGWSLLD